MNFLAHLHLSYPKAPEMVGNFIGDYVKGKKYKDYPSAISQGILLHRKIDEYTDHHPLQLEFKGFFRADYGLYAGIISDMFFDHFLAKHWSQYSALSLQEFSHFAYTTLFDHYDYLPKRVQDFLPKMRRAERLESYASMEGIEEALLLMTRYTTLPDYTADAMAILKENEMVLEELFTRFYVEMMAFVKEERETNFGQED